MNNRIILKAILTILTLVLNHNICEAQTKRTIHVATAGTLPNLITANEKYTIEELILTGELNGTDFSYVREMAGDSACIEYTYSYSNWREFVTHYSTNGKLKSLDISNAVIVGGGAKYNFEDDPDGPIGWTTDANSISCWLFSDTNIESIIIGSNVTKIYSNAFLNCKRLNSIKIENGNNFYDSRDNCNAIIEKSSNILIVGCINTIIPNSVTSIGWSAFSGRGLTSITIPNSVTSIGENAFSGCSSLNSITIPNGITSIFGGVFSDCSGLTSITIPNSVTTIGGNAFSGCSGLTSITIPNGVTSIGWRAFSDCSGLTSITIPNSVTDIGGYAFYGCSGLTSLSIPNSVVSINERAFVGCSGLTSIVIPNSVTRIDYGAFAECNSLSSIMVESGNSIFDSRDNCNAIIETSSNTLITGCKNTTIPNSVTSIGDYAFYGCSGMTTITIPNSLTSIGKLAFADCSGLTSITIPNSVTRIDYGAFAECNSLSSIMVESGNSIFDSRDNCNAIIETSSNTLITGCKNTIIPNSVTSLGTYAFYGCSGMTTITIPNSVTSIGTSAFNDCSGLTSITIPNSVTDISYNPFSGCNNLSSIMVQSGNSIFDSRDNCNAIIETSSNTLITGCKNTIIPNSVTSIGNYAFHGCSSMPTITIPNSVTSIGYYAFVRCSGLKSIVSEIEKPFVIYNCFDNDTYTKVELIVPKGTKSLYQSKAEWSNFTNIVEEGTTDEVRFVIDGTTYLGSKSDKTVVVKFADLSLTSLEIPASVSYEGTSYQVTGNDDHAFDGSKMAALIWGVEAALSSKAFNNANIGSNFLLYVRSASYAPSSVKNVVVNGSAQSIVLSDDGGQFYCPQAFTAEKISYTHYYNMETGGEGKGWETIALPFNVQKISHGTRGEIVPFASYNGGSSQKPFWLASMSSSGFSRSSSIQANQPYIIAMPNSNKYQNDYNLAGDVTFSAENVNVPATPTFSGTFLPAYSTVAKSASVYALNVKNRYVSYSGNYDAGSRFISNLRDVRPFEAYISESSTRGIIEIGSGDGTTGMPDVIGVYDADRLIDIYTLSGQKVAQSKQSEIDNILNQLPHGVYIVNGKKIVK